MAEGTIKRVKQLDEHRCRVDIERSSIALRKSADGDVIAVKRPARASPEKALLLLAIDKSRRALRLRDRTTTGHFRFGQAWEAPLSPFLPPTSHSPQCSSPP